MGLEGRGGECDGEVRCVRVEVGNENCVVEKIVAMGMELKVGAYDMNQLSNRAVKKRLER